MYFVEDFLGQIYTTVSKKLQTIEIRLFRIVMI